MAVKSVAVTVGTSATLIYTSLYGKAGASGSILVCNPSTSSQIIYVGGDDVSSTIGVEVPVGQSVAADLMAGEKLYAIAAGSQAVRVLSSGA